MENLSPGKNLKLLFSGLGYGSYPFDELFDATQDVFLPSDINSSNGVLVLWGGEDIAPSLYNQQPSKLTGANYQMSTRDTLEVNLAGRAIKEGIPILGICRGAQLLCALAGGRLVQHVDGHASRGHEIMTSEGKTLMTTSVHHQMMYPWEVDHRLLAWTNGPKSRRYVGEPNDNEEETEVVFPEAAGDKKEVEVVYFPALKGLAIQGHPEFISNEKHEFILYSHDLIKKYLMEPFLK